MVQETSTETFLGRLFSAIQNTVAAIPRDPNNTKTTQNAVAAASTLPPPKATKCCHDDLSDSTTPKMTQNAFATISQALMSPDRLKMPS